MANVNDGSVVWSLNKINNAEQLNGLTAEQIKNNAINGSGKINTVSVSVGKLTFSVSASLSSPADNVKTIPLPSGYNRSQCRYYIDAQSATSSDENKVYKIEVDAGCINQSNGVVTARYESGRRLSISPYYICIAVK